MTGVLYITYDGLLEPLGQSQVLSYLRGLSGRHRVHIVSFEKSHDWHSAERNRVERLVRDSGITWHPLRYHKRPTAPATSYDILAGITLGARLVRRNELRVIHARSYVPSVMALAIKRLTGAKYVFDMRGLWADERVDGGIWPAGGTLYQVAKRFERRFLLEADHIVSLTHAAVREIEGWGIPLPPISVIPTCADLERFVPGEPRSGPITLGYVGSAGTWYRFDAVARAFLSLRTHCPDARLLVVNRGQHELIRGELAAAGVSSDAFEILALSHSDVPGAVRRMDLGVFFYRPSPSRVACAPTKLGEFLGCGIPCITNSGVGDSADVLRRHGVGTAIDEFDDASIESAIRGTLPLVRDPRVAQRCVDAAHAEFSLANGTEKYHQVYEAVTCRA
jgi:glycosyltransferase involved in cell wall biosynthesis